MLHTVLFNGNQSFLDSKPNTCFVKGVPSAVLKMMNLRLEVRKNRTCDWNVLMFHSLFYLRLGMASSMLATSAAFAVTRMGSLMIHRTVCNAAT